VELGFYSKMTYYKYKEGISPDSLLTPTIINVKLLRQHISRGRFPTKLLLPTTRNIKDERFPMNDGTPPFNLLF
jgi:hypothetical protein